VEVLTLGHEGHEAQYLAVTPMISYILQYQGDQYHPPRSHVSETFFDVAMRRQHTFNQKFTHYPELYSQANMIAEASRRALHIVQIDTDSLNLLDAPPRFHELNPGVRLYVADSYWPGQLD
jgi:hypothetical protein